MLESPNASLHVDHVASSPLTARRAGALKGRARVPGDKSISHRALIFGALTVGETRISGLLEGEDVINTANAMRALGARVERTGEGAWRVFGVGVGGFRAPDGVLDFGNSGTGCRLVMGAVGGCPISATFDGDASLRRRPMQRILEPLARIGARAASAGDGGRLPITLAGARDPIPIVYRTPVCSSISGPRFASRRKVRRAARSPCGARWSSRRPPSWCRPTPPPPRFRWWRH